MTPSCILGLSFIIFTIGIGGVLTRRNLLVVLLSIELMLAAGALAFIAGGRIWGGVAAIEGQVAVLITIAVSATEAALGLSLAILWSRLTGTTDIDTLSEMKG